MSDLKKIAFLLISIIFTQRFIGQDIYKPIDTATVYKKSAFLSDLENRYERYVDKVEANFSGKSRKKLKELYKNQFEGLHKDISKGELYYNEENKKYLENILGHIVNSNPSLEKYSFYLEFSRYPSANAYSVGDGTLIIQFDLLNYLHHEGELASIIAHEISHYILEHRDKSYENLVLRLKTEDYKKKKKNVYKERYGRQSKAEGLLKEVVYSRKHKSRKQEYEADSLGFELLSNTKYDINHAVNSLMIYSDVDMEKDSLKLSFLREIFNTANQQFDEDWLFSEDFSQYTYTVDKNWNVDSLKTHPDCDNRIEKLGSLIEKMKTYSTDSVFAIDQKKFNELKSVAEFERINNMFLYEWYGKGLYETLKAMQTKRDDKYLLKTFCIYLNKLYEAKKDMKFSKYVPPINPKEHSDSEQRFINFMYNISSNELEKLVNDYNNKLKELQIP